ncbi:baculoviral IAP repeat-containing protein 7-B-like [Mytilus galloprovincialis]|uniref:baculoviral IAP repeat-containing protein 7-B-like n=1 Tax=Mytilus galloprovincialis TaxID=29158 RepID=UPI003F7C3214
MYCTEDISDIETDCGIDDNTQSLHHLSITNGHSETESCFVVPNEYLNQIADQSSQLLLSGGTIGFAGTSTVISEPSAVNGRHSFVHLNGHSKALEEQARRDEAKQTFLKQAAIQQEIKRKYLYTKKTETESTQRVRPAKFRAYDKLEIRIKSFVGFKSASKWTESFFANSGFFYKGFSDIVACFFCGLVHKNWKKDDDPIIIHFQLQPDCHFIIELRNKGIISCKNLVDEPEDDDVEMREVTAETNNLSITPQVSANSRLACKVCLTYTLEFTIQPCNHFAVCGSCCRKLMSDNKQCPICRGPIEKALRTLIPE